MKSGSCLGHGESKEREITARARSKDRREACISGDDGVKEQTIVGEDEAVSSSKLLVAKGERERDGEVDSEAKESRWRM